MLVRTTGTEPRVIFPDGGEEVWPRAGPASISEIGRLMRVAAEANADTLVLESMAIEPAYLWASEWYLMRATHLVVTNLRPDHEEVFRQPESELAAAVSSLVPRGGRVFLTAESDCPEIRAACAARGSLPSVVNSPTDDPLEVNRQLALAVCAGFGITEAVAGSAMDMARPDNGSFAVCRMGKPPAEWVLVNAFACNDPLSLERLWLAYPRGADPIVVLNARSDRPLRTRAFLASIARLEPSVRLALVGRVPSRWIRRAGFDASRVIHLSTRSPQQVLGELGALAGAGGVVWGVGNYAGFGAELGAHLRGEAAAC